MTASDHATKPLRNTLREWGHPYMTLGGTDKLAGVLGHLEQRRCRLEQPREPRSMGLFRRLVREAVPKIAVETAAEPETEDERPGFDHCICCFLTIR